MLFTAALRTSKTRPLSSWTRIESLVTVMRAARLFLTRSLTTSMRNASVPCAPERAVSGIRTVFLTAVLGTPVFFGAVFGAVVVAARPVGLTHVEE